MGALKNKVVQVISDRNNWVKFNKVFVPLMGAFMAKEFYKLGHIMGEWTEYDRALDAAKKVVDKD